jgi:hypothetical protein
MRFIGLDGHRDFCEVAIAEAGVVRLAGPVRTEPAALLLFAQSLGGDDEVALEATAPVMPRRVFAASSTAACAASAKLSSEVPMMVTTFATRV